MSRPPRSEVVALLGDIKDNPEDPTPRLVLCDWLEENGDEADRARAEFMRLDLRGGHPDIAARKTELWRRYKREWLAPLSRESMHCRFVGGLWLLWSESQPLEVALDKGLAQLETWAWVVELKLTKASPALLSRLSDTALLQGLPVLDLADNDVQDAGAQRLAASPYLTRLRSLSLRRTRLTSTGARALLEPGRLPRLTTLDLRDNRIGPTVLAALQERFGAGALLDNS